MVQRTVSKHKLNTKATEKKQNQISLTVNRFYVDFNAIAPWEKKACEKKCLISAVKSKKQAIKTYPTHTHAHTHFINIYA